MRRRCLRALQARGLKVGVISNSHRSLDAFCEHFSLGGLIHASVSSSEHGYMKPHRSIFDAALERAGVPASAALMVGDSLKHDVEGALAAGMRAVLLRRSGEVPPNSAAERPGDSNASRAARASVATKARARISI